MNDVTLMEKMAEVAPQHYDFLLKTAEEIKTSPYKDEIVEELDGLMKIAIAVNLGPQAAKAPSALGSFGRAAAGVAGGIGAAVGTAALGGIAMALAGDMYDAAKRGITKTRNYKQMMNANPDLRELPAKSVQKAFSVLHRFNPEFSSDPTVAGAWVKRQATFGEDSFGDVNQMKQLIDSRKSLSDVKRLPQVPEVKGLGRGKDQKQHPPGATKKDIEEMLGKMPKPAAPDNAKMDEILRAIQGQNDEASQFFNSMKFSPGPFGGQTAKPKP